MFSMQTHAQANEFHSCSGWYALYTRHQHEKTVARILTGKGFEIFLPLYSTTRNWKDRTKLLSLPLFPCYVFLKGCLDRRLDVLTTPGVHALISGSGHPAVVPEPEIDAIRRALQSGSSIEPHPLLKCGDSVRVKSGALKGIEGILVRRKNVCRLVLSIEMLGKAAAVEIDSCLVERLTRNSADYRGSRVSNQPLLLKHANRVALAGS
jgi:transcription antitermination factor NusG